ncbi:MAG: GyrI-like domain-containing protein [Bacillota bacterium]
MTKLDLKKEWKEFYTASQRKPKIVQVPARDILAIDGRGDPNTSPDYQAAVEALYSLSYTLKFMHKRQGTDYTVLPLEGLWWADDYQAFAEGDRENWQWTALIVQPDFVSARDVALAIDQLKAKGKDLPALPQVRYERWEEGPAAQIMHLGPYDAEAETIARLHEFIQEQGLSLTGKHHEIYLSDPRRTAPEKLKTIIRQPVSR